MLGGHNFFRLRQLMKWIRGYRAYVYTHREMSVVEPEYYECPGCGSILKFRIRIQPSLIARHEATKKHKNLTNLIPKKKKSRQVFPSKLG